MVTLTAGAVAVSAGAVSLAPSQAAASEDIDWTLQDAESDASFHDAAAIDSQRAWAVGTDGTVERTVDGGEDWEVQDTPDDLDGEVLMGVTFVDEQTGWAVGSFGAIIHTDDGGDEWTTQEAEHTDTLHDVDFVDEQTGWAVGTQTGLLHTSDGGTTWTEQVLEQDDSGLSNLQAVVFVDKATGWIAAPGTILHTSDGGESWDEQDLPAGALGGEVLDLSFADERHGWVVASDGSVLHTSDGGGTWTTQDLDDEMWLQGVGFADRRTGVAVATASETPSMVRTADGGATWTEQEVPSDGSLSAVELVDATAGWAVGDNGTVLRYDVDAPPHGTQQWEEQDTPTERNLQDIAFADEDIGWAVGRGDESVTTDDGGATWTVMDTMMDIDNPLTSVTFFDAEVGWATGFDGEILRTPDAGTTWQQRYDTDSGAWADVAAVGRETAMVVGADADEPAVLYTDDSGEQWEHVQPDIGDAVPRGVAFSSADTVWVVGDEGLVLRSEDGGETWDTLDVDTDEDLYDVAVADDDTAWIVGDEGTLLHTTDAGDTWNEQVSGTDEDLLGVAFVDADTGWAIGAGGVIRSTVDGGGTWYLEESGTNETLTGIAFLDDETVWASGANGTLVALTPTEPPEPAQGTIVGTVHDDDEVPVDGAEVVAEEVETEAEAVASTDESGDFELPNLDAGTYDVTVSAVGFESATEADVQVEAGDSATVDVDLQPIGPEPPGSIAGTVAREPLGIGSGDEVDFQEPVAGAVVEVVSESQRTVLRTLADIDGHYEVTGLPDGEYRVQVGGMRRYLDVDQDAEVADGAETTVDLTLVGTNTALGAADQTLPDLSMRGHLAMGSGYVNVTFPLRAIEVVMRSEDGEVIGPLVTDSSGPVETSGAWRFWDLPEGEYTFEAMTRDTPERPWGLDASDRDRTWTQNEAPATVDRDWMGGLTLNREDRLGSAVEQFDDWGALEGSVVDADSDEPIGTAVVQIPGTVSFAAGIDRAQPVAADGEFLLDHLWSGEQDIAVWAPGYQQEAVPGVMVDEGQTVDLGEIQLEPVGGGYGPGVMPDGPSATKGGTIEGELIDTDTGEPIDGGDATVQLLRGHDDQETTTATVDEDGGFSDEGFAAEASDYRVHAIADGYEPTTVDVWVGHGDTLDIEVSLDPIESEAETGTITGTVIDAFTDEELDDAVVEAVHLDPDSADDGRTAVMMSTGSTFEFDELAAGSWQVTAAAVDGYRTEVRQVEVEADAITATTLGMDVDDEVRVTGSVTDEDGDSIADAEVLVEGPGHGEVVATATTDADGRYFVGNLETDQRYTLTVDAEGHEPYASHADSTVVDDGYEGRAFTHHPRDVELSASSEPAPAPAPPDDDEDDPAPDVAEFDDVSADSTHATAIAALVEDEIMQGYDDDTFGPDDHLTRGQTASVLARAFDLQADSDPDFDDVEADDTHADAIAAVSDVAGLEGNEDGTFGPHDDVSRGQLATIMAGVLELEATDDVPDFDDVDPEHTHAAGIAALAEHDILEGYEDGTFGPDEPLRRDQAASVIHRALEQT